MKHNPTNNLTKNQYTQMSTAKDTLKYIEMINNIQREQKRDFIEGQKEAVSKVCSHVPVKFPMKSLPN